MKKIKNQNRYLIASICCILLLLLICYFGINNYAKGTSAANSDNSWCTGYAIDFNGTSYCCPDNTYSLGYDIVGITKENNINSTSTTFKQEILTKLPEYVYCVKNDKSANIGLKNDHVIRLTVGQEGHKIQDPQDVNVTMFPYYLGVQGTANSKQNEAYSTTNMDDYCNNMNGQNWSANESDWQTVSNGRLVKYTGSGDLYYSCKADSITRLTDSTYGIPAIKIEKAEYRNNNYNPFYSHAYNCSYETALDWVSFTTELNEKKLDIKTQEGINEAAEIAKNHVYCLNASSLTDGNILYQYMTDPGEMVTEGRKLGETDSATVFPDFGPEDYAYSLPDYNNIKLITLYQNGKVAVTGGMDDFCKALNGNNWSKNENAWQYLENGQVKTCTETPCKHTDGSVVTASELVYNCKRNNLAADDNAYNTYGYTKATSQQATSGTVSYSYNYYDSTKGEKVYSESQKVSAGTTIQAADIEDFIANDKYNNQFIGWYMPLRSPSISENKVYSPGDEIQAPSDYPGMTMYAVYNLTIKFNSGDGNIVTDGITNNTTKTFDKIFPISEATEKTKLYDEATDPSVNGKYYHSHYYYMLNFTNIGVKAEKEGQKFAGWAESQENCENAKYLGNRAVYVDTPIYEVHACYTDIDKEPTGSSNTGHTCGQTNYGSWTEQSCYDYPGYNEGKCYLWNSAANCCQITEGTCNGSIGNGGGGQLEDPIVPPSSNPSNDDSQTDDDGNPTDNPQTGDTAIFIVLAVGLAAITYFVIYYRKSKQN